MRPPPPAGRSAQGRLAVLTAVVLGAVLLYSAATMVVAEGSGSPAVAFVVEVPGIPGPYCAYGIEKELRATAGVTAVVMDWEAEEVRVRTEGVGISADEVRAAVEASEYPYEYVVR